MSDAPKNDAGGEGQVDTPASIGARLSAARKKQGLDIETVARELHLDSRIVRALENDEREHLPEPIFVKGYLKIYGRLVGLPVDQLIREYSEQAGEPRPLHVIRPPGKLPAVRQRSNRLVRYVIVLLLAAILLWLAWPFIERYIESRREPAGEQVPGHLELPPVSELNGDNAVAGKPAVRTRGRSEILTA